MSAPQVCRSRCFHRAAREEKVLLRYFLPTAVFAATDPTSVLPSTSGGNISGPQHGMRAVTPQAGLPKHRHAVSPPSGTREDLDS